MNDPTSGSQRRSGITAVLVWTLRSALFHAGWLAQGQLGMSLSWSWFGGLGGVALWWLLLALWSGARVQTGLSRHVAAATAAAVGLVLAVVQGATPAGWLGWGLNLLAWSWLCSRHRPWQLPGCAAGWLGTCAGVLMALGLAADTVAWSHGWQALVVLLMLSLCVAPARPTPGHGPRMDLPMGLMMGSLLPMAQWCSAAGWNAWESVGLHLAAMLAGLAVSQLLGRQAWRPAVLACAAAASLGLGPSEWTMLAAAMLAACASGWTRPGVDTRQTPAWLGALGLLLVGALASRWGPDALRLVLVPALVLAALHASWRIRPLRGA